MTYQSYGADTFVKIKTKSAGGGTAEYASKIVLVSVPLGVLKSDTIKFSPPLPPRRQASIDNLGFGILNKVTLIYSERWWAEADQDFLLLPKIDESPGDLFTNRSSAWFLNLWNRSKVPVLQLFVGGSNGDQMEKYTDDEVSKWTQATLARYFKSDPNVRDIPTPKEVIVTRWRGDPFARGSYTYIPPAGVEDKADGIIEEGKRAAEVSKEGGSPLDLKELSHPLWNRWFFAGEHTIPDHFASVHGAYLSGVAQGVKIDVALKASSE